MIGRVEATLGGKPPKISGKIIKWDRQPEDDQEELAKALMGLRVISDE